MFLQLWNLYLFVGCLGKKDRASAPSTLNPSKAHQSPQIFIILIKARCQQSCKNGLRIVKTVSINECSCNTGVTCLKGFFKLELFAIVNLFMILTAVKKDI